MRPRIVDSWAVPLAKVERVTGANPVDCGQHRDGRDLIDRLTPINDETKLDESLSCARRAEHVPFWRPNTNMAPTRR
jgi:hypothetical protein